MTAFSRSTANNDSYDWLLSNADRRKQLIELIRLVLCEELHRSTALERAEWFTTIQTAAKLQVSPSSLEKARSTGRGPLASIPYHKLGRSVRYARADVVAAVACLRVPGSARKT